MQTIERLSPKSAGLGFGPAAGAIGGSVAGPIGTVVGTIAGTIASIFSFGGGGTEIDQQNAEFQAEIQNTLYNKSRETGSYVFCLWYERLIGVTPDNRIVNAGTVAMNDVGKATSILQNIANTLKQTVYLLITDPRRMQAVYRIIQALVSGGAPAATDQSLLTGGGYLYPSSYVPPPPSDSFQLSTPLIIGGLVVAYFILKK